MSADQDQAAPTNTPARRNRRKRRTKSRKATAQRRGSGRARRIAVRVVLALLPLLIWQGTLLFVQMKARTLIAERQIEDARSWLGWVNSFSFRSGTNEFLLARCARKLGDYQATSAHLQTALYYGYDKETIQREQWLALAQTGDLAKSEPHLSELLVDHRGDGQEICEAYVLGYLLIQQYAGAEELLRGWSDSYPEDSQPWFMRGIINRNLGQWKSAETAFRKVIELSPDHHEASFHLGSVLLTLKNTEEALKFLKRASQDEEYRIESQVGQAHCYRLLGQPAQTRKILETVLRDHPTDSSAGLEMGRLALDDGDYATAVTWLEPLADKDPRNTDARYALASALLQVGRSEDAQAHFSAVNLMNDELANANQIAETITTKPDSAADRMKVAAAQLKYGSQEEGLFWLRSAISVNPTYRPALEALVKYYERKVRENPETPQYKTTAQKFRTMLQKLPLVPAPPVE
jgi:tetratricopeptide (TPR) repeat protein